jgi:hypothetical protein
MWKNGIEIGIGFCHFHGMAAKDHEKAQQGEATT